MVYYSQWSYFVQLYKIKNKLGKLRGAANQRYLQYEDGAPFFSLGDTAWELFHRLNLDHCKYPFLPCQYQPLL